MESSVSIRWCLRRSLTAYFNNAFVQTCWRDNRLSYGEYWLNRLVNQEARTSPHSLTGIPQGCRRWKQRMRTSPSRLGSRSDPSPGPATRKKTEKSLHGKETSVLAKIGRFDLVWKGYKITVEIFRTNQLIHCSKAPRRIEHIKGVVRGC